MGWVAIFARLPAVLRITAVALLAIALARPQTFKTEDLEVEGIDIMIVLDLSKSMEETDLQQNRLDAGQRTIKSFMQNRRGDRLGLVVFAREAMLHSPLTLDYGAFEDIVDALVIGDVPEMGTAIGDALGLALASLRRAESKSKVIILISDGDSNTSNFMDPYEAKQLAAEAGVRVFTVLMGATATGGQPQAHAINPALLQEIAADTGGRFFPVGADAELDESFESIRADLEKSREVVKGQVPDRELFAWLAGPALVLLLLELLLMMTRWRRFP
jgi:Ca-activated chloride channel family protein